MSGVQGDGVFAGVRLCFAEGNRAAVVEITHYRITPRRGLHANLVCAARFQFDFEPASPSVVPQHSIMQHGVFRRRMIGRDNLRLRALTFTARLMTSPFPQCPPWLRGFTEMGKLFLSHALASRQNFAIGCPSIQPTGRELPQKGTRGRTLAVGVARANTDPTHP